jgi:hypothetical protein
MPELFEGKQVSVGTKKNLKNLNTCMIVASFAIPFLFYVFLLAFKLIYDDLNKNNVESVT